MNRLWGLNRQMMIRLLIIAVGMFGFGYALVPLYKAICELTGINVLTQKKDNVNKILKNSQVDTSRTIKVVFDANERGDWRFKPEVQVKDVHPGEMVTVVYEIENATSSQAAGQAIPSYLPKKAEAHFNKLECFCFAQQKFNAGETRRFPVVFVVDSQLPKDVHTITLSYTFFGVAGATAAASSEVKVN